MVSTVHLVSVIGETFFPETTNKIKYYLIWNGLKLYTIVKMRINSFIKKCIKKCKLMLYNDSNKEDIHFIHDGIIVKSYTVLSLKNKDFVNNETFPKCDFILCYTPTYTDDKYNYNVIRLENAEQLINYCNDSLDKFTASPVNFLGIKIKFYNSPKKSLDINFGKVNFFMNGNTLFDKAFVNYYLNKFHYIILSEHEDYEISFLGPSMEIVCITGAHYIELKEDKYSIRWVRT